MKKITMFAAILLALAACQATTSNTTQSETDWSSLVGRLLTNPFGAITLNGDGTTTGELNGSEVNLTWVEENGLYCREGTIGAVDLPRACLRVRIDGNSVDFVNSAGEATSSFRFED